MLVIRKEQMVVMSEYMFDSFVSNMVVHLRATYPEKTENKNDESIRKFVRDSVERANSFNVHAADNLETFLECATLYGSDFFRKPEFEWAKTILEDDMIDETEKMNRINEYQVFSEDLCAS